MKLIKLALVVTVILILLNSQKINAHCEIPCGIYADSVRVVLILEHIATIEKAMVNIENLSKSESINYNQLMRWVINKEEHAEKIQEIVSQYFLHQRIKLTDVSDKAAYDKYLKQLSTLHEILVYSMEAKQSTKLDVIENLRRSVDNFSQLYFHKH
jgi:nickel superoxide dismutase